jgi:SHS2 domain-containing protein
VVRATTLPELFSRAAWALFAVITDVSRVQSGETHPVTVEAVDEPALLVRWLSELNYRHVTRHELYAEFEIQALSPNRLVALVRGEPIDLQRHTLHTEVKAVTFHGLQIDHDAAGWRAQVILDL